VFRNREIDLLTLLDLPIRDGNCRFPQLLQRDRRLLDLPIRDGNGWNTGSVMSRTSLLDLPIRDGNEKFYKDRLGQVKLLRAVAQLSPPGFKKADQARHLNGRPM